MGRAPCCDKANVKKGPWSSEEDAKLKAYIEKYGTGGNWIALPQKVGLKRCGKSCRLRWLNYLRPNIKHGGFTEEEDNIICSLYIGIGSGSRWSIIAAQLPGRTDNDIKNYWNTRLKKKLLGRKRQNNAGHYSSSGRKDPNKEGNGEDSQSPSLSSSALERLQLHIQLQTLQDPFSFSTNPAVWPKMHAPFLREKLAQRLQLLNENHQSLNSLAQSLSDNSLPEIDPTSVSLEDYARSIMAEPSLMTEGRGVDDGFGASKMEASMANGSDNQATLMDQNIGEFDYYDVPGNSLKDNLVWWPNSDGADMKSESGSSWDSSTGNIFPTDQGIFEEFGPVGESMWHQSLLE